ncbi:GNAT family N-acetyltransferase [Undibacterium umbellatum]|uniref:GNAT family N-acetyltransferase n=1 Tax=Undibacterium umbellatum TaxID=2762300 RepID=A0ABR6Z2X9_9BURK|nr:GNAT family N-acetyltransferase [Undibacterium umbellatum]MBC3906079.1 GNAT family N-acetyltransferase [Undibacterium umbellatum]
MTTTGSRAHNSEQTISETDSDFHFRDGLATDALAISQLISQFAPDFWANPDGSGADLFLQSVSESAEFSYLTDSRYHFILAWHGETLAGFIAMRDLSHLFHLFVNPSFQRQKLASTLWQHARQYAAAQGHAGSFTVNSSLNAIPVYERFSFQAKGEVVEMHGIAFLPMQTPVVHHL